jgi:hypothetical protein
MRQYNIYKRQHLEIDEHEGVFINGVHQNDMDAYVCVMEEDNFVFKQVKSLKRDDWII